MDENSELSKSLADMMLQEQEDKEGDTLEKQLAGLEAELLETKRAAVFFKQQGLMNEARDQLSEIRRLNTEISKLRAVIGGGDPSVTSPPLSVPGHPVASAPTLCQKVEDEKLSTIEI